MSLTAESRSHEREFRKGARAAWRKKIGKPSLLIFCDKAYECVDHNNYVYVLT